MQMRVYAIGWSIVFLVLFASGCQTAQKISLWERHCGACHDGKTVLNGKTTLAKEQMVAKYKTSDEFARACLGTPSCMNILKHERRLFTEVGNEIGIKNNNSKQ
jgi:hypothetical protein